MPFPPISLLNLHIPSQNFFFWINQGCITVFKSGQNLRFGGRLRKAFGINGISTCIETFNDYVDKYHAIYEMLSKRMSKERFTSSFQEDYRKHFYMYTFVLWDRDLETLKEFVNWGYPRYTTGRRAKLTHYPDPFRYSWIDSMEL